MSWRSDWIERTKSWINAVGAKGALASAAVAMSIAACLLWTLLLGGSLTQPISPKQIEHENGNAYLSTLHLWRAPWPLVVRFDSSDAPRESTALVFENGRSLGPAHSVHDLIRNSGSGRYSHWSNDRAIYFSTSDNSDPRVNGREYAVHVLAQGPWWSWLIVALLVTYSFFAARPAVGHGLTAIVSWVQVVYTRYPSIARLLEPTANAVTKGSRALVRSVCAALPLILRSQWTPLLVFFLLFVAGRLWFFVDYPIGGVHPDSRSYFVISEAIQNSEVATFGERSPLLPVVMAATFSVVNKLMALVYVQTALSCVAGLLMIYAVYSLQPVLSLPVAVALGAYFMDVDALEYDSAMLTESLYTSLLVISFALFLKCFSSRRPTWFAGLCSMSLALVIYTKPGGMYLLVIYVMVLAYLVWRQVPWSIAVSFAAPFPALLLALATYNYQTIRSFVLSASDATEISLITNLYWETNDSYPEEINAAILRVQKMTAERSTPAELHILNESWDFQRLYDLYIRSHYYGPHGEIAKATADWGKPSHRSWLLRISMDAIERHPELFLKHFVVMMRFYYKSIEFNTDLRQNIYHRVNLFYIEKQFSKDRGIPMLVRLGKEFADPTSLPRAIAVVDFDKNHQMDLHQRILFEDTFLTRIYLHLQRILHPLFSSLFWSFAQILVFALSLVVFIRSRFRHDGAFLLLVLVCAPLGNAMVVSLVEYSQSRYSYPLEWAYYVAFLCLPLLVTSRYLLPTRGDRTAAVQLHRVGV